MATGYSKTYARNAGDVIEASDFVTEFGLLDSAFDETSGHTHDGTTGGGARISALADAEGNNKVVIDTSNNEIEFYVEVTGSPIEQLKIIDGVLEPSKGNDIDLGSSSKEFKNLYIDGTANIDSLVADTADINGGTLYNVTFDGPWTAASQTCANLGNVATCNIDGGSIDGCVIGGNDPRAGYFTTLNVSSTITFQDDSIKVGNIGAGALPSDVTVNNGNWSGTALDVNNGGTGATDAATARTNLGLGSAATFADTSFAKVANNLSDLASVATARANLGLGTLATLSSINNSNWSGTDLAVANGGTGASTAADARTNLGVVIGTNVFTQRTITGTANEITVTNGDGVSANPTISIPSTVSFNGKTISNLGTVTTANIDGGTIDGTVIGGASAAAGTFTTVTASSNITSSGGHIISSIRPAFLAYLTSSIDSARTIVFDNDSSNDAFDNNDNYNTSTGVFTAPVAGIYQFSVNLLSKTRSAYLGASIRKNNYLVSYVYDEAETDVRSTGVATVTLKLAVNDTVSVYSNVGGIYGVSTRGEGSYFSGHLVG